MTISAPIHTGEEKDSIQMLILCSRTVAHSVTCPWRRQSFSLPPASSEVASFLTTSVRPRVPRFLDQPRRDPTDRIPRIGLSEGVAGPSSEAMIKNIMSHRGVCIPSNSTATPGVCENRLRTTRHVNTRTRVSRIGLLGSMLHVARRWSNVRHQRWHSMLAHA